VKILFATDGSGNARAAAGFLREFMREREIELVLLTVSSPPDLSIHGNVQNPDWEASQRNFIIDLHDELEDQFSGLGSEHLSKLHKTGSAAAEILKVATSIQPDLIVLGAVGHSMVHRMLLGSVSDNVATHAKCSVLIVRPQGESESPSMAAPKRIAIAYDGSAASSEAVNEMMAAQWHPDVVVDVVTVVPIYDVWMGEGISVSAIKNEEEVFERMRKRGDEVSATVAKEIPNSHSHILRGQHVGEAIVDFCDSNDTDLVFVGDTGHGQLHDWLIGSTTKYVLRHAPCSVWVSRHDASKN
tara:strand:- start:25572 stop:26471 length:900 start_codon:yes stop_codon:yes gene_type:complete